MAKKAEENGARRRKRRSFTPEFKAEVVALVRQGERSLPAICRELDLGETAVRSWVAQVAEVEVNLETGQVRVLRIAAVHDVGRVVNPKGLSSQFYGGILQAMGFALTEKMSPLVAENQTWWPCLERYMT